MSANGYVAIGDIHGCLRSLEALLEQLTDYNDRLFVFVGDYIDRGPHSKGVVDLLLDFKEEQECIFLRGNHEQMLLDAVDYGELNMWLRNGGKTTLQSYQSEDEEFDIPKNHLNFYRDLSLIHI